MFKNINFSPQAIIFLPKKHKTTKTRNILDTTLPLNDSMQPSLDIEQVTWNSDAQFMPKKQIFWPKIARNGKMAKIIFFKHFSSFIKMQLSAGKNMKIWCGVMDKRTDERTKALAWIHRLQQLMPRDHYQGGGAFSLSWLVRLRRVLVKNLLNGGSSTLSHIPFNRLYSSGFAQKLARGPSSVCASSFPFSASSALTTIE